MAALPAGPQRDALGPGAPPAGHAHWRLDRDTRSGWRGRRDLRRGEGARRGALGLALAVQAADLAPHDTEGSRSGLWGSGAGRARRRHRRRRRRAGKIAGRHRGRELEAQKSGSRTSHSGTVRAGGAVRRRGEPGAGGERAPGPCGRALRCSRAAGAPAEAARKKAGRPSDPLRRARAGAARPSPSWPRRAGGAQLRGFPPIEGTDPALRAQALRRLGDLRLGRPTREEAERAAGPGRRQGDGGLRAVVAGYPHYPAPTRCCTSSRAPSSPSATRTRPWRRSTTRERYPGGALRRGRVPPWRRTLPPHVMPRRRGLCRRAGPAPQSVRRAGAVQARGRCSSSAGRGGQPVPDAARPPARARRRLPDAAAVPCRARARRRHAARA